MSLKGSLQTVALPEVLHFLASTGKTGELRVSGSRGDGRLWFDQGRIGAFEVARSQEPVEALFQLLRIDDGDFSFAADAGRSESAVSAADGAAELDPALEAAEARMAEWRDVVTVVPSLDHRLTLSAVAPAEPVVLEPDQWLMVVAVGTGATVGQVLDARELQEFDGCRAVRALVEASLIEVTEPATAVAAEPTSFETFVTADAISYDERPASIHDQDPLPGHDEVAAPAPSPFATDLGPFGKPVSGADEEPHGAPAVGDDDDHYAALRAAVVEIGEDIVPVEAYEAYDEPVQPVYELHADPQMDGRAALQALLSEVSEETVPVDAGAHHDSVDGLADRGPWTDHELSVMDAEGQDWSQPSEDSTNNILPFVPAPSAAGYDAEAAVGEETPETSGSPDEGDTEDGVPAEEPINRGLLLKFLSSVRN